MSGGGRGVVIAGAGPAGVRTAQTLRDLGYGGRLRLFSEEDELPYDRPPLSKEYLTGRRGDGAIRLQEAAEYAERGIELVLGRRVVAADLAARTVGLSDGSEAGFDRLVVATGARPRVLPVLPPAPAVHHLRTAADARRLAAALRPGRRVVLVGGGFIGLEVACAARAAGCAVTVVEAAALPLASAVGPEPARALLAWHTARGVAFRLGVTVAAAPLADAEAPEGARALRLDDGSRLTADVVVVGVGVVRETGWLRAAGLTVHHGLVCDDEGRTGHPAVFGAGDVVCRHDPGYAPGPDGGPGTGGSPGPGGGPGTGGGPGVGGGRGHHGGPGVGGGRGHHGGPGPDGVGVECLPGGHWTGAVDGGARVAGVIVGGVREPVADDGFFWSDQGGLRLQFAGRHRPGAQLTVVSGSLDTDAFVVEYTELGRLTGVFAANSPRAFLRSRRALRTAAAGPEPARTAGGSRT